MIHDFATIWSQRADVLSGLLNTVILLVCSAIASIVLGALVTPMLMSPRKPIARLATAYVDAMRCAPFLLFVYLIYFGLPTLGIRLSNWWAGAIALIVYNTAYMAELLRGAWHELPAPLIESGKAFGFSGFTLLRRIILPPIFLRAMPMIGNQVIQIVKDSAFLTVIAVNELTHEMTGIQSTYFIPFAAFVTAVLLYWCVCLAIEAGTGMLNKLAEERRA
ncbi:amino acid ABC transporter permease [Paraburkholderia humisilvae]|uniref:Putative glutamine ABC transporter permease protein GlnM n=1 Tax=Paraburkholderia humisilvae TaxID=627669 RepID=A0A6J5EG73_9BURK|nr:amino acid ABC transporter permease [Paraburkholderia humisilvae]CAB3764714.1 putative glutamine ABC transporter permease protein GlnM [Paraburkholderia humisilvae]